MTTEKRNVRQHRLFEVAWEVANKVKDFNMLHQTPAAPTNSEKNSVSFPLPLSSPMGTVWKRWVFL